MEDIFLIASIVAGVVLVLILMFVVSKFLMREQSYERVLQQKKLELESSSLEQKPGKQKRRYVYSKHNDKQKLAEDKPKLADDMPKVTDQKQKQSESKQKLSGDKQQSSDENQKSPAHQPRPPVKADGASTPKKHVEIDPQAETIDPETDLPSLRPSTPEKSLPSNPSRSILVNKDEKSLVIDTEFVPETFHPRPAPVDELDRKQQEEVRRSSGTLQITKDEVEHLKEMSDRWTTASPTGKLNQKKKKKAKATEPAEDTQEKPVSSEVVQMNAADQSPSGKPLRKNSKELITETMSLLEKGEVEDGDCKRLVKILEDRGYNVSAKCDGIYEGDYAAELHKRQIKDLELAMQKDKSTLTSANAQIKQLKDELASERQKSDNMTKTHQVISTKQNQEINELRNRMDVFSKTKDQEWKQYKIHLDSLQAENISSSHTVKALMEENEHLKEISLKLEQKLLEKHQVVRLGESGDVSQKYLEDNIKQFENQFEEMVAIQEMEKLKEENETLVFSLRNHIEELKAEIVEKENKIENLLVHGLNVSSDDQPILCEQVTLTGHQNRMEETIPACSSNGLSDKGNGQDGLSQVSSQEAKIKELQEQLQIQKQKNDDLRRRNWKTMEALSEVEKELQNSQRMRAETEISDSNGSSASQNLLRLKDEHVKTIAVLQNQIADLKKEIESKHRPGEGQQSLTRDVDIIKLEESLNRQIQKNDDLRRRNWKTMEALAELEKQMEGCLPPKSRYEEFNLVDDLKEQVRFLQKEKQDYAVLKTAKISADSLNASLQKQIGQLELVIGENNAQIKQLEKELSAQKSIARELSDVVFPSPDGAVVQPSVENQSATVTGSPARSAVGDDVNRKEVMVVTRIQETAKWDLSQLVLELDTKTAEVEILQSLLDHNEKTLHDLQDEKSKNLESVHHMRQALKERDVTIELLKYQLKTSSGTQDSVPEFESNSIGEVLSRKDDEIEQLKTELLQYQARIKDIETRKDLSYSPKLHKEPISEDGTDMFDSKFDNSMSKDEAIPVEIKVLQDQVKHYQDVLAETVGMLSKLQSSVEQEECTWRHKFESAEDKAAEALKEAEQLRIELETLRQSS